MKKIEKTKRQRNQTPETGADLREEGGGGGGGGGGYGGQHIILICAKCKIRFLPVAQKN